ncbi:hypothetical protein HNP24_002898 [Chryseobacterium sediminis]|uniref:YcxB family protein n=1 Tax=Chryseobacterium sediminis TaxID=1679494 RepID=A0ABR6Q1X1_9FLAO|nr:hypothetical protein [Chryseobacterium sediminis]MBB6331948.1 hypothetical protein [Chryseobacterium sediminis]
MDESIKLQINFNEDIERKNQKFFFQYLWKKKFTELKKTIIYAILFLALGFFPPEALNLGPVANIFKYGGVFFSGYIFLILYHYFRSKNKTFKLIEEQIDDLRRKKDEISFITLHQDSITFKNPLITINCIWDKTTYKIIDQCLIVNILNNKISWIFTGAEFKENEYNIFLDFLQQHSKKEK